MKHKVLLVLLLGIIISVSASAQKVTMNLKQVKLEKVFSAITQQTGLTVAYSRTIVNPDRMFPKTVRLQYHTSDILRLITLLPAEICPK